MSAGPLLTSVIGSRPARAVTQHISIELVRERREGGDSDLVADLRALGRLRSRWVLLRLRSLSDEELVFRCQRVPGWADGPEGRWVTLEPPQVGGPWLLLAQLWLVFREHIQGPVTSGVFKLVRILPPGEVDRWLAEQAAAAEGDE